MALVSVEQAKTHIREPNADDADVEQKLADAEAVVLDYLKVRHIAIESVSVANPTVITTAVPHSLTSGVTYPIVGTTTTPTVVGSHVVTVLTPTTFTVPVNVTVGQDEEAGTVGAPAWTEATVPGHVRAAILLQFMEFWRFRGDDTDGNGPAQTAGDLSPQVTNILRRKRDPALA